MTTQPPRRVPDDVAATPAEIAAAIEALTPGDWARLKRFADYRIRKLGPKANSMTGDDLLQTALTDLLGDVRRWNKSKVGFMGLWRAICQGRAANPAGNRQDSRYVRYCRRSGALPRRTGGAG